jgi:2-iminobutanoate/2-iminopropanoate deaminase
MQFISTPHAPKALGHYSQAVVHGNVVYVSGQLPLDPYDDTKPLGSIEEQTLTTLNNIDAILKAAGSRKDLVLKATIYITDIAIWAKVNEVYGQFFGDHKPARAAVPVKDLPKGCQLEIEVIAAVDSPLSNI